MGKSHDDIDDIIFKQDAEHYKNIADVLDEHCVDKRKVMSYIKGLGADDGDDHDFSRMLNGEIDVDKMDYLVREAYYTGVAYGVVDNIRLIQGLDFFNGRIVITEKGILPAEHLLFSRFLMCPTVYNHHTARIAQLMFLKALEYLMGSKSEALALRQMDDSEIDIALRYAEGYPGEMMMRINES